MSIAQPQMLLSKRALLSKRSFMSKKSMILKLTAGCILATGLAGCEVHNDRSVKVGKMLITNPKGNHPIRVSKQMVKMHIPVRRGDYGLNAEKKLELGGFISRFRRQGEGRVIISAPAGQPNEVAAFNVLNDVRDAMKSLGITRKMVTLSPYSPKGDPEAPIIVSYLGYSAQGPKCGFLTRDFGGEGRNLPGEQLSCAVQANVAAMIANPKDLIQARDEAPRSGERRDIQWKKFLDGKYMGREKSSDQKSSLAKK